MDYKLAIPFVKLDILTNTLLKKALLSIGNVAWCLDKSNLTLFLFAKIFAN